MTHRVTTSTFSTTSISGGGVSSQIIPFGIVPGDLVVESGVFVLSLWSGTDRLHIE